MAVSDRIKELARDKGVNIKEFSAFLEVSERTIQNCIARISLPNGRFLTDMAEKTGASATWILVGNGPKYLSDDHQNFQTTNADFIPVTRFTVEASAGHGSLVQNETGSGTYAYNRSFLDRRGLKPENLAVRGDSMEPDLADGDLYVKRIQRASGKRLMLVSSNPVYHPVMVEEGQLDGVKIIGRVVNSTHEW